LSSKQTLRAYDGVEVISVYSNPWRWKQMDSFTIRPALPPEKIVVLIGQEAGRAPLDVMMKKIIQTLL
jgi:hypothetical protein